MITLSLSQYGDLHFGHDVAIAKGDNYSTESLFMVLILQQQKLINQLIKKLSRSQNETISASDSDNFKKRRSHVTI